MLVVESVNLLHLLRMNRLCFGDNLHLLRNRSPFPDTCINLIYLDLPCKTRPMLGDRV
jgi:hypothetical protein